MKDRDLREQFLRLARDIGYDIGLYTPLWLGFGGPKTPRFKFSLIEATMKALEKRLDALAERQFKSDNQLAALQARVQEIDEYVAMGVPNRARSRRRPRASRRGSASGSRSKPSPNR